MSSRPSPLSDHYLPVFDVETAHTIEVRATPGAVLSAARRLDMRGSWIVRSLFRLRGLPPEALDLSGLEQLRFKTLRDEPGKGFVLGLVGQFWTPSGELLDFSVDAFRDFSTPGYAKATWAFEVSEEPAEVTRLSTVTRVRCLDEASRRRFRFYWRVVGPFSGIIRTEILKSLKAAAEAVPAEP